MRVVGITANAVVGIEIRHEIGMHEIVRMLGTVCADISAQFVPIISTSCANNQHKIEITGVK